MASVHDLKPAFQSLLRPACRALAARGVTANQVTLAALALSLAEGAALAARPGTRAPLLALPVVLLVRMALNALDGMLAREHGMTTALGAFLNELGDVVSDAALALPLAFVPGGTAWVVVGFAGAAALVEMAGLVAVQVGASRRYDGPMGKSDRALVLGVVGVLLGAGVTPGPWLPGVLGLATGLAGCTIVRRVRAGLREIGGRA